jgi:hypothetical protein
VLFCYEERQPKPKPRPHQWVNRRDFKKSVENVHEETGIGRLCATDDPPAETGGAKKSAMGKAGHSGTADDDGQYYQQM